MDDARSLPNQLVDLPYITLSVRLWESLALQRDLRAYMHTHHIADAVLDVHGAFATGPKASKCQALTGGTRLYQANPGCTQASCAFRLGDELETEALQPLRALSLNALARHYITLPSSSFYQFLCVMSPSSLDTYILDEH